MDSMTAIVVSSVVAFFALLLNYISARVARSRRQALACRRGQLETEIEDGYRRLKFENRMLSPEFPHMSRHPPEIAQEIQRTAINLLIQQIDKLERQRDELIKRFEDKILSKWDVAKVVFQIIGVLGLLVALAVTVIEFLKN